MFDQAPELYDLFYGAKDYAREAVRVRDLVRDRQPSAASLLDVACGTGAHLAHLQRWFKVEGVDIDDGLLAIAKDRLPGVPLHRGDMRTLELGTTFDAVTCLFSSIGYVQTVDGLHQAVASMARHLAPGGLLVIEPWLTPEALDPSYLGEPIVVARPGLRAVRMNGIRVEQRRSTLDLHYLVGRPGTVEHRVEEHVLGLFTDDEYRASLEAAGLAAEHDPEGLIGRGLWIGTRVEATAGAQG
jgi:SAM-dependent methyltransferase